MHDVLIGCGQITWPRDMPPEQVLAEIALAGYAGAPAGPRPDEPASETIARFARYGLRPAPGYLSGDFWDPAQRDTLIAAARRYAQFMRHAGCSELYVAAGGWGSYTTARGLNREQISGRVQPDDALRDDELRIFADTLNAVGRATLDEGVRACFHNHVGSVIETRAELDALMALTDPEHVFLGPDTGHLAWAGDDPVACCRDYAHRIKTMHLKDINPAAAAEGRARGLGYDGTVALGLWVELGRGAIDFAAILDILGGAGFSGWLIVETDVTSLPSALESAQVSRAALRRLGV